MISILHGSVAASRSKAPAGFSPADIAGLIWARPSDFDGTSIEDANGSEVTFTDINGVTSNPTGINGLPSLAFAGSSSQAFALDEQQYETGDYTLLAIVKRTGGHHGLFGHSVHASGVALNYGGPPILVADTSDSFYSCNTATRKLTEWSIVMVVREDGVTKVYNNGAMVGITATSATGIVRINRIGVRSFANNLTGEIADVMLLNRAVTPEEGDNLHTYLGNRYNLKVFTGSGDTNIVVVTDSNGVGYGTEDQGKAGFGWPHQLARLFDRTNRVYNGGVNGAKVSTHPLSTAVINSLAIPGKYNVLIYGLGTNDLQDGTLDVSTFVANYNARIDASRASFDLIKIVPIVPRSDAGTDASYEANRLAANAAMAADSGNHHDGVFNIWSGLNGTGAQLDGRFNPDECHINNNASAIYAAQIYTDLTGITGATLQGTPLLHVTGDSLGSNGSLVTTWEGGTYDLTAASGEEPTVETNVIMGKSMVKFASGKRLRNALIPVGTSSTVMLASWNDTSASHKCFYTDNDGNKVRIATFGGAAQVDIGNGTWNGDDFSTSPEVSHGHPIVHGFSNDGVDCVPFAGGVTQNTQDGSTAPYIGCWVGANPDFGGDKFYDQYIHSIAIFSPQLTESETRHNKKAFALRIGGLYEAP